MAQQGTSADLGFWRTIEFVAAAKSFPVDASTLNFIRARLRETASDNIHRVRAAVYSSAGNLLYQSSARQDITTAGAEYDFTFTGATLAADTYYFVMMGCGATAEVEISNAFDSGDPIQTGVSSMDDDLNPASPVAPATLTLGAGFENFSILIDYTEGGAATPGQSWQSKGAMGVQVAM